MKKFMMMAIMLVASAAAFAGDSPALKEILKQKSYADAEALVQSSLSQLANDAEKAKAYNKLVDLALAQFDEQNSIAIENQVNKQMNKEEKPVDEKLMTEMAYKALLAALECDKYDQMPNEKGKVAPKFDKKNAQRLWLGPRNQLVNGGQDASQNHDDANALKYWGAYVDSYNYPFFADNRAELDKAEDAIKNDQYNLLGKVAYFAGDYAHRANDLEKARKYFKVAADNDYVEAEFKNAAHANVLNMMKEGLKDKADSLRVLDEYKEMYSQKPDDDLLLDVLYNFYGDFKDKDAQNKLLEERLAKDPKNFIALANKGLMAMQDNNAKEAVDYLSKASEVQPTNVVILHYLGMCLNAKAAELSETNPAQSKEVFKQAIEVYDKCKELDPEMLQAKWGYNRFQSYYNYYGDDALETKQAEADYKY